MCVFGDGCESFGGCKSGMNLPPNPMMTDQTGGFGEQKLPWGWSQDAAMARKTYNAWLQHAATDVNAKKHHKKEIPVWWLSQADIDRYEPKRPTKWERFLKWWRSK